MIIKVINFNVLPGDEMFHNYKISYDDNEHTVLLFLIYIMHHLSFFKSQTNFLA